MEGNALEASDIEIPADDVPQIAAVRSTDGSENANAGVSLSDGGAALRSIGEPEAPLPSETSSPEIPGTPISLEGGDRVATGAAVPHELIELDKWVVWRRVPRKEGFGKKPYAPNAPEAHTADVGSSATWAPYHLALKALRDGQFDGIGLALKNAGIVAIDVDKCRDPRTGELHPIAVSLIAQASSYAEVSPSGTGVHILGRATGHYDKVRKIAGDVGIDIYCNANKYITVTGMQIEGTRQELADLTDFVKILTLSLGNASKSLTEKEVE